MTTNKTRATWAAAALDAYLALVGGDRSDAIGDLIGDLGHLADRDGVNFIAEAEAGLSAWADERTYPPDGIRPHGDTVVLITICMDPLKPAQAANIRYH